jgi:hypothetical protein
MTYRKLLIEISEFSIELIEIIISHLPLNKEKYIKKNHKCVQSHLKSLFNRYNDLKLYARITIFDLLPDCFTISKEIRKAIHNYNEVVREIDLFSYFIIRKFVLT